MEARSGNSGSSGRSASSGREAAPTLQSESANAAAVRLATGDLQVPSSAAPPSRYSRQNAV